MTQSIKQTLSISLLLLCLSSAISNAQDCGELVTQNFIDNNDGTVSDPSTGLMWKKCIEKNIWDNTTHSCAVEPLSTPTINWKDALIRAVDVNSGTIGQNLGQTDWRVPNIKELLTIADTNCVSPAINEAMFPSLTNTPSNSTKIERFWSSTYAGGVDGNGSKAYSLDLRNFVTFHVAYKKSQQVWVRLVRDIPAIQ